MSEIDLSKVPELKGLRIIMSHEELEKFFTGLRQDWYPVSQVENLGLKKELDEWLRASLPSSVTFFAANEVGNHFARYQRVEKCILFRCVCVACADSKVYTFRNAIQEFFY